MDSTNNLNESYHKKYEKYSPFKRQLKTCEGAQFRSDITRYRHNFNRFKEYISEFWQKIDDFKSSIMDFYQDFSHLGIWNSYLKQKEELEYGYGKYLELWNDYITKI